MNMNTHGRIYTVKGGQGYFDAGLLPNGEQALMGVQLPELVAVRFSTQGELLGVESRLLSSPDEECGQDELQAWQDEISFKRSTIHIRAFFIKDRMIGVRDLPEHYQDVLDHPKDFDAERRATLENDAKAWLDRGDYVLFWDEDYYLNRDGEVDSS